MAGKRPSLTSMLATPESLTSTPPSTPLASSAETSEPEAKKRGGDRDDISGAAEVRRSTRSAGSNIVDADRPGPRYLTYQRKEARLSDEQADRLTALTRRLNKARRGRGERITDNTLIRIAVDQLLTREGDLAGTTEHELSHSLNP